MAIMRPNELWTEKKGHIWVSDGKTPILGSSQNPPPSPVLPALDYNVEHRAPYVLQAGTIVTFDSDNRYLIPCNGGEAATVTYTSNDVTYGVKKYSSGNLVPTTVGASTTFPANKPVGWVVWDILQNPLCSANKFKTDLMQDTPTIFTFGLIYLPVVYLTANKATTCAKYDFAIGDYVVADGAPHADSPTARLGGIRKYVEPTYDGDGALVSGDSMEQVVGRIVKIENESVFDKQGLENFYSDGIDVQSDATQGFPRAIWNGFKDSSSDTYTRNIVWVKIINL